MHTCVIRLAIVVHIIKALLFTTYINYIANNVAMLIKLPKIYQYTFHFKT